jgi:hypothetical protein
MADAKSGLSEVDVPVVVNAEADAGLSDLDREAANLRVRRRRHLSFARAVNVFVRRKNGMLPSRSRSSSNNRSSSSSSRRCRSSSSNNRSSSSSSNNKSSSSSSSTLQSSLNCSSNYRRLSARLLIFAQRPARLPSPCSLTSTPFGS